VTQILISSFRDVGSYQQGPKERRWGSW